MKLSKLTSALLIVLFFYISGKLSAQTDQEHKLTQERRLILGINAGPAFTTYLGNFHSSANPYNMKPGYMAGISAQLHFTSRFSIRWEVNYERSAYTYLNNGFQQISIINGVVTITDIPPRYVVNTTNKLIVPVTLKYNIIQKTKTSVFVDMGTFLGLKFSRGYAGSDLTDGLIMGMGIQRSLWERATVLLEIRGSADDGHFGSATALFGIGYKI